MASEDAISRRLWGRALNRATEIVFDPKCADQVRRLADDGARRIISEGSYSDSERLQEADENMDKLISKMVELARDRGQTELTLDTFHDALSSLCPIFPFC